MRYDPSPRTRLFVLIASIMLIILDLAAFATGNERLTAFTVPTR